MTTLLYAGVAFAAASLTIDIAVVTPRGTRFKSRASRVFLRVFPHPLAYFAVVMASVIVPALYPAYPALTLAVLVRSVGDALHDDDRWRRRWRSLGNRLRWAVSPPRPLAGMR